MNSSTTPHACRPRTRHPHSPNNNKLPLQLRRPLHCLISLALTPTPPSSLSSRLQQKLESGEDHAALKILQRLVAAQPAVTEWKFLTTRVLSDLGETEEILESNPLIEMPGYWSGLLLLMIVDEDCGMVMKIVGQLPVLDEVAIP
ncbi:hypothetical protein ACLB2K_015508 [Fragaria x ananassa]